MRYKDLSEEETAQTYESPQGPIGRQAGNTEIYLWKRRYTCVFCVKAVVSRGNVPRYCLWGYDGVYSEPLTDLAQNFAFRSITEFIHTLTFSVVMHSLFYHLLQISLAVHSLIRLNSLCLFFTDSYSFTNFEETVRSMYSIKIIRQPINCSCKARKILHEAGSAHGAYPSFGKLHHVSSPTHVCTPGGFLA